MDAYRDPSGMFVLRYLFIYFIAFEIDNLNFNYFANSINLNHVIITFLFTITFKLKEKKLRKIFLLGD